MLKRIYIDNYKCLTNFEYRPGAVQLMLGGNGSGKSTVFEVLTLLRSLIVDGATTPQLFKSRSLTRWQTKSTQTIELEVSGNGGTYVYRLAIEHQAAARESEAPRSRVGQEELTFDGRPVFSSDHGKARLFRDDHTEGLEAVFDWERSGISWLSQRAYNQKLTWFRDWLFRLYRIQLNPFAMDTATIEEQPYPQGDLRDFASWYRHLIQEHTNLGSELTNYLKPIIDGFERLSLKQAGETTRILMAEISGGNYNFGELSEGQRAIVCLYTLLALMKETQVVLCIDEPDNFVALPEIQPWLMELQEQAERHGSQVLVISHHPELIDYLVPLGAVRFFRTPDGPARVAPFAPASSEALSASEIVARGWDGE